MGTFIDTKLRSYVNASKPNMCYNDSAEVLSELSSFSAGEHEFLSIVDAANYLLCANPGDVYNIEIHITTDQSFTKSELVNLQKQYHIDGSKGYAAFVFGTTKKDLKNNVRVFMHAFNLVLPPASSRDEMRIIHAQSWFGKYKYRIVKEIPKSEYRVFLKELIAAVTVYIKDSTRLYLLFDTPPDATDKLLFNMFASEKWPVHIAVKIWHGKV